MRELSRFLLFVAFLPLVSCTPITSATTATLLPSEISPSITPTAKPSKTPTIKIPTLVPSPTWTFLPSPSITPISALTFNSHTEALDESNSANEMTRLLRIGSGTPQGVSWSPDGKTLAVATGLGVFLYDAVTFDQVGFIDVGDMVTEMAFSPDGENLAVARETIVSVWDVSSGQKLAEMEGDIEGGISNLAYGQGGHVAAYGQQMRGLVLQRHVRQLDAENSGETASVCYIWRQFACLVRLKSATLRCNIRGCNEGINGMAGWNRKITLL